MGMRNCSALDIDDVLSQAQFLDADDGDGCKYLVDLDRLHVGYQRAGLGREPASGIVKFLFFVGGCQRRRIASGLSVSRVRGVSDGVPTSIHPTSVSPGSQKTS